jgi:NTE family protein
MAEYKLGIALGGGGTRGYAHIGVLQALKEKGIEGDVFSGTSAGALVGAFMAAGKTPKEVFKLMKRKSIFDFAHLTISTSGLMTLDNLANHVKKSIPFENLEDLPKPLIVTVADMYEGKVVYLNKGPLVQSIIASASIPVIFEPIAMNGTLYNDGAIFDNLPHKPLDKICDHVIAIHVSPIRPVTQMKNMLQTGIRAFELTVNGNIRERKDDERRTFIAPKGVEEFALLDVSNADSLYELAYQHTMKMDFSSII